MCIQRSTTLLTQRNKRNFSTIASWVSASPRRRHCRCRFLASKKGRSVDEYHISVATTTGQLLSSQQLDYCCCRRNIHADITDETVMTRLVDHRSVPPAQRVAPRRFQNYGTPFTWDKTPYQSATSRFHEWMSLRPSYVLHMRRCVLRPTTSPRLA